MRPAAPTIAIFICNPLFCGYYSISSTRFPAASQDGAVRPVAAVAAIRQVDRPVGRRRTQTEVAAFARARIERLDAVVGSGGKAVPLTEQEIYDLGVERREIVVGYAVGDSVRVIDGPLSGFIGVVDELEPDKDRVRVVVSMFGRETPVDLELDQVEEIKD